jgi:hypothetical protein
MIELLLEAEQALSLRLLDRAEILYRQVAAADPRNAIAVVGLARVTLERGDEEGALKLARRALTIDPENGSAQRMTERLEEVLRYRGAATTATPGGAPASAAAAEPAVAAEPAPAAAPAVAAGDPTAPIELPGSPGVPQAVQPERPRTIIDRLLRRRR